MEIDKFRREFVTDVLLTDTYDLDYVINFDETSITRDAPSDYTIDSKGVKQVKIRTTGSEKTSYTVALAVSYTGRKLRAMLIWPSQGKKTTHGPLPDNIYLEHRLVPYSL